MRTLTLTGDPATFVLEPRPAEDDDFVYEPLPHGLTLDDAVVLRAHQVRAGDLVIAEFSENWWGEGRYARYIPAPFPADPHTFSSCPCERCEVCDEFEESGFAAPHTTIDRNARYICLAPSDDDGPCDVSFRNAPIAVIPAAVVQAHSTP